MESEDDGPRSTGTVDQDQARGALPPDGECGRDNRDGRQVSPDGNEWRAMEEMVRGKRANEATRHPKLPMEETLRQWETAMRRRPTMQWAMQAPHSLAQTTSTCWCDSRPAE